MLWFLYLFFFLFGHLTLLLVCNGLGDLFSMLMYMELKVSIKYRFENIF